MRELEALRAVDFDWTRHTSSVWQDPPYHTPELHTAEREVLLAELDRLSGENQTHSPLGQVVLGPAGAGKTHLLGSLRPAVLERGAWFVLVDTTDVRDFWETTRQGFLDSLLQPLSEDECQYQRLLRFLLAQAPSLGDSRERLAEWAGLDSEELNRAFMRWVAASRLDRRYPRDFMPHVHTLRALFLLNSDDFFMRDAGYNWLQSIAIDEEDRRRFRFRQPQPGAADLVRGLSWAMSLVAPTLLACDQLDAIVAQHHLASYGIEDHDTAREEERAAAGILHGIGGGLMALRDQTRRTLTIVTCLEKTWQVLEQRTVSSFRDRFDTPPRTLSPLERREVAEQLVANRLEPAFAAQGFEAPYPTWPFRPEAFAGADGFLPRELLKRCETHRRACLEQGRVVELASFGEPRSPDTSTATDKALEALDQRHEALKAQTRVEALTDPGAEDMQAAELVRAACRCLLKEQALPDSVDATVDETFAGGARYSPLHARLRLIFHDQGDREQHFSFRVLQQPHARAYQSRLKAAMTTAGIDSRLSFRRLTLVRNTDLPGGRVSEDLTRQFRAAGGVFASSDESEWRSLYALAALEQERPDGFEAWLQSRRPASGLSLMRHSGAVAALEALRPPDRGSGAEPAPPKPLPAERGDLLLGHELAGGRPGEPVTLAPAVLTKHTVILAGAGSGKTVLVRRLVETAALAGIPAIVVDPANDLARLGDAWPEPPEGWLDDDPDRARRYWERTEVVVWTPGRSQGHPLQLDPLPDLAAVADDPDELQIAVALAQDTLLETVAAGRSATARN
ncbi:MAG: DUF87 domain-containing protein, partial [Candidatus Competibacterales bacterium]|nr:DUF87 domain-containing protein [Candidatus Competibacterales bacterium]